MFNIQKLWKQVSVKSSNARNTRKPFPFIIPHVASKTNLPRVTLRIAINIQFHESHIRSTPWDSLLFSNVDNLLDVPSSAKILLKKMNLPHEPIVTCIILPISNDVSRPLDPPNTLKKKERIIRKKPFVYTIPQYLCSKTREHLLVLYFSMWF